MRKTIRITRAEKRGNELWLVSDTPSFSIEGAVPKCYMLVNSDEQAFVYIIEKDDEFVYVSIPQPCWKEIKEVLTEPLTVWLQDGTNQLELIGFSEELAYLIENIAGNANYGEEMEKAVKETFLT
ncbi:hypothetical protein GGR02_002972 [Anoxybacillus voinovskiensis]|uniref:UPF0738 protein GGR02_002972 n=1 Tax=Anoxybacteroides voinovskiense TaxID=230470 RepID=A0A840DUA2_9BACL|nr:hypothetical protein [Anoxybacillus voinovskiensis]MBB4075155.1 hypothetical protein [Anoxybacillus voinovskiensis]GGJ76778.1 UPF0738 protein [Anoxybacillus voinovskiensis]